MLRNYLTVGLRALLKNRTYAFINILGLAIGMAACLLIFLYVRYETSYDRWVPGADRIYQLQSVLRDPDSGEVTPLQQAPYQARLALQKDFPQIDAVSFLEFWSQTVLKGGQAIDRDMVMVEPDFLKMFPLPFIHGDAAHALPDPNSVILSKSSAVALFGTDDVVGRTLTYVTDKGTQAVRVTGVYRDVPKNTHIELPMIGLLDPNSLNQNTLTNWGSFSGHVYVRLRPGTDPASIEAQFPAWAKRNAPIYYKNGRAARATDNVAFSLVPLPAIHLSKAGDNDRRTIATFAIVALLILAMACANFVNLATARASQRAREVALRKVVGARRKQLVSQFLAESVIVAAIAMLIGLALAELALPWLRDFLDADFTVTYFGRDSIIIPALALTLLAGLLGGVYPAFYLTRFRPGQVLKANRSTAEAAGTGRLRNMLVIGQFAISIGLIICTAVIYAQTVYARTVDPGFQRSGLLQVRNFKDKKVKPIARAIEQEIGRIPGVESTALTNIGVNTGTRNNVSIVPPGGKDFAVQNYTVEPSFFRTMGIPLLAGRYLSDNQALDDITAPATGNYDDYGKALVARGMNVVVNQNVATRLGFRAPAEAVGKQVKLGVVKPDLGMVPATIVGVVGNTRYNSVRDAPGDMLYFQERYDQDTLEIRFKSANPPALKARVEAVWKRLVPQVPFSGEFADAITAKLYKKDVARGEIFAAFAGLAIIVGCLGLFGLAAFTAERRTKEIGIRKVLGARARDIVRLLAWQFAKPVLIANLIAWPVAWWAMRGWLNGFDTRIALGPTPFLLAGGLALVIAIATVAGHAFRVARSNPVKALRYE